MHPQVPLPALLLQPQALRQHPPNLLRLQQPELPLLLLQLQEPLQLQELLLLQQSMVENSFSQLNHGVITSTDYISQLNSLTQMQLNREVHRIRLKESEYNYLHISGNL